MFISDERLPECDLRSLMGSILTCSTLRLMPNTTTPFVFIKPRRILSKDEREFETFKWITQVEVGYQGWLEILYRQPQILIVKPELFYENEIFKEIKGSTTLIEHLPLRPSECGERIGAYAKAHIQGVPYPEVTTIYHEELEKIKAMSFQYSPGYSFWGNEDQYPF